MRGTLVDRQRGNISIDNENTQIEGSTDLTSHAQMETPSNRTRFTCLSLWIERTVENDSRTKAIFFTRNKL